MKKLILIFALLLSILVFSAKSYADLGKVYNCVDNNKTKECTSYLIGIIDSLIATRDYCPDGNTSYGYLTDSLKRYVKNNPNLKDIDTYQQMKFTIKELRLGCS